MLDYTIDFWDYLTFAVLLLAIVVAMAAFVWIAGLPGRIAIQRKHPDAEAVKLMGYAGFLPVMPWIQAFIWAFKPTDVVDIRRFPRDEAKAIEEENYRLSGKAHEDEKAAAAKAKAEAKLAAARAKAESEGQGGNA
jgi:Protein of unknown function (DUF3302)